jgi:hypothetical protein
MIAMGTIVTFSSRSSLATTLCCEGISAHAAIRSHESGMSSQRSKAVPPNIWSGISGHEASKTAIAHSLLSSRTSMRDDVAASAISKMTTAAGAVSMAQKKRGMTAQIFHFKLY